MTTVVAFHVVVTATDGRIQNDEGGFRLDELHSSADILGVRCATRIHRDACVSGERTSRKRRSDSRRFSARTAVSREWFVDPALPAGAARRDIFE
ncbi:hypothetical protein [Mycobacterium seoulense]|uniref:hypothetical protein n=1 Tax=Mycobacterium seoulense TaxID=386911 RepID=UPI001E35FD90|nr:hypothetical protein [Mycobacterium seoulense]